MVLTPMLNTYNVFSVTEREDTMPTNPTDELMMAQALADRVGTSKRQVQIWTDAGAVACLPETDRQGRGRQRLYSTSEVPIAALVAVMARFKLPIGSLLLWSRAIRGYQPRVP